MNENEQQIFDAGRQKGYQEMFERSCEYVDLLKGVITDLKKATKRLLDESWNGPIDADHPAREFAAKILSDTTPKH